MHQTLQGMGLGERADEAIAAYRADYTSRGWARNRLFDGSTGCWPTCAPPASGLPSRRPRRSRRRDASWTTSA